MPPAKSTAAKKAAAARAEKKAEAKARPFKFRGLDLKGPAELPGTFDFDFGRIQVLIENDDAAVYGAFHRLFVDLLGEDQLLEVRSVIKAQDDSWQMELLGAIGEAFGTDAGEASASAKS